MNTFNLDRWMINHEPIFDVSGFVHYDYSIGQIISVMLSIV